MLQRFINIPVNRGAHCLENFLKNSTGKPSGPGDFPLCHDVIMNNEALAISASRLFLSSVDRFGVLDLNINVAFQNCHLVTLIHRVRSKMTLIPDGSVII